MCLSLGSFREKVLDTMQVKVVYSRGGSRRPGEGGWKVREGRKAAGTECVKQVTTVDNWKSVMLGNPGKQHRLQTSVLSN